MIFLLLSLFFLAPPPFLIVWFWQKRPIIAFILAAVFLLLLFIVPGIIQTFQAMMIYGSSDPQLMAGGIAATITGAIIKLPITLIILAGVQWIARRRWKQKTAAQTDRDIFS